MLSSLSKNKEKDVGVAAIIAPKTSVFQKNDNNKLK